MSSVGNQPYREMLLQHFEKRKVRNTRYSLRAFARDLEVPVSRLSDVFNGKKGLSIPMAVQLAVKLGLSPLQKDLFVTSVQVEKEKIDSRKKIVQKKLDSIFQKAKHRWTHEEFEPVSKWLDLAICTSLSFNPPPTTPEALADLFEVEVSQINASLKNLLERREIEQTENGWTTPYYKATSQESTGSECIARFHAEMMAKAKSSLFKDPPAVREFSNIIFSFNTQDLPLIKERLSQVQDQLILEFGQSTDCDSIYDLALAFFPISKKLER